MITGKPLNSLIAVKSIVVLCGVFLCAFCIVPTALFAVEDDLDQFFEDYFSDDFEDSDPSPEAPIGDEIVPEQPVSAVPVVEEKQEEAGSSGYVDERKFSIDGPPSVTVESDSQHLEMEREMALVEDTYLPDIDDLGASYLDSYIDPFPHETWAYSDIHQQAKEAARSVVIDKTIQYLIGEEVESPTIEIRGDVVSRSQVNAQSLKECIVEATKRHLPIDIAREKVLLYRRHIRKAMRDLFPQVTGSVADYDGRSGGQPDGFTEVDTVKLGIRQPLYTGGSLWSKVRENQANLKMAMAEYTKIYSDLALEVSTAYFNLAKARTMVSYREDLFEKAKNSLGLSEEKYAANLISEIEHLNVQSQESQLNHNVQQGREDIELALLELQKSMYLDLNINVSVLQLDQYYDLMDIESDLNDSTGPVNPDEKKLDELIGLAYDNRPEFVIGESKVNAKKYAEKAERAKWMPQVSMFCEMGRNREWMAGGSREKFGRWETQYHLGIECSWNLFGNTLMYVYDNNQEAPHPSGYNSDGKGNWRVSNTAAISVLDGLEQFAIVKEKEIERKEAILEFELSEKDMVSEVKESYYNFNRAKIQMRSVVKKIAYREKLVELARHRSEINEIQISEYLQAEIDLVEERNTLYQAMVDFFIARASLNKAIGVSNFIDIEQLPPELQL